MIAELLDTLDQFEVVRDQIAAILAAELSNQVRLAEAVPTDPTPWTAQVYAERAGAFPLPQECDQTINVWFDSADYDKAAGNAVARQRCSATFNVDCYGYASAADDPQGGHVPGDEQAARNAQRLARLSRRILMAGEYTYLGLRGVVGGRWPQQLVAFQPQQDNTGAVHVVGARLVLRVEFNETSPQLSGSPLEAVAYEVKRAEDGSILVAGQIDY